MIDIVESKARYEGGLGMFKLSRHDQDNRSCHMGARRIFACVGPYRSRSPGYILVYTTKSCSQNRHRKVVHVQGQSPIEKPQPSRAFLQRLNSLQRSDK